MVRSRKPQTRQTIFLKSFNTKRLNISRILSWLWVIVIFLASKWTEIGINLASACISRGRTVPSAQALPRLTRGDRRGWRLPVRLCTSQTPPGLASRRVITNRQNLRKEGHFSLLSTQQARKSHVWEVFLNFSRQTQTPLQHDIIADKHAFSWTI